MPAGEDCVVALCRLLGAVARGRWRCVSGLPILILKSGGVGLVTLIGNYREQVDLLLENAVAVLLTARRRRGQSLVVF